MLRFRSNHTTRISNSLAALAALVLLVSALASYSDSGSTIQNPADLVVETEVALTQTVAGETPGGNTQEKSKSFKVSLFLFRID